MEENKNLNIENNENELPVDELTYENAQAVSSDAAIETESKAKKTWQRELYEWVSSIAVAVVLAFIINTFFISLVVVDGQSMVPTLQHGERLIVRKIAYTPDNGDIIVVKSDVFKKYIIKRIISLPGQEIGFDAGRNTMVDGKVIEEPYISELQMNTGYLYTYPTKTPKKGEVADIGVIWAESAVNPEVIVSVNDGKITVTGSKFIEDGEFIEGKTTYKQNGYFVMGDNRNGSSDSRSHGFIPEDEIVGEALIRFMPVSKFGTVK